MSFYSDASLIVIPSGYKASKVYSAVPTDGTGDLVFTRSNDTATRVNSAGLIEKVRTNLVLQSNSFDTTWTNSNSTETSGQAGYDGTNNAWRLDKTAGSGYIIQTISLSGVQTFSVYAKAGTDNWMVLLITGFSAYYDLQNGVLGTVAAGATATITSVGSGWYRCTISASATTTGVRIYPAEGNNDTSGTSGNILIQAAQLETGDIATAYIPTTTAAVSVGPVANVPRLDYLNSTCPKLLLEPQTTALNNFSEQIDNAYWTKANCTVTANQTASPSGYVDAELVLDDTSNSQHVITRSIAVTSGNKYTASFFLKAAGYTTSAIRMGLGSLWTGGTGPTVEFDFVALTGTVVEGSGVTFTIEDYGNGWRRCSVTGTCVTSGNTVFSLYVKQYNPYIGSGTNGVYAWGANIMATGYLQSYIPTLGAAVTRGVDACVKTGISSLLGGTQGTWFLEMKYQPLSSSSSPTMFVTGASTIGFASSITNGLRLRINAVNDIITSVNVTLRHKIAISFDATGVVCFFNGNQITLPNGASEVVSGLDSFTLEAGTRHNNIDIYQMLYLPTRLDNATLASLTTL